jgi:ribose/xylose/arabinose/galactoside ABC-type transport system permease subunit
MKKTRFGRYVYAIGGSEEAAVFSGVPVVRYKVTVWSLHGLLVGAAAVILTSRAVSGHATLGEGAELESIAATVIGGTALGRGRGRSSTPSWGGAMGVLCWPQLINVDLLPDGGDGRYHRRRGVRGPVAPPPALTQTDACPHTGGAR